MIPPVHEIASHPREGWSPYPLDDRTDGRDDAASIYLSTSAFRAMGDPDALGKRTLRFASRTRSRHARSKGTHVKSMAPALVRVLIGALILTGCAEDSTRIRATEHTTPNPYADMSCSQLHGQLIRVGGELRELSVMQDGEEEFDDVLVILAALLPHPYWAIPLTLAVLPLGSRRPHDIADLKGDRQRIEDASVEKSCF